MAALDEAWPVLDYQASKDTLEALHLQTQLLGKVKLALTRLAPEWQNIPLLVNASGLTTGLLPGPGFGLELAFDRCATASSCPPPTGARKASPCGPGRCGTSPLR